tara:strand:- start:2342 stop:4555 length:2214 start_codon:yes stop_codon:yes gene_type:complete
MPDNVIDPKTPTVDFSTANALVHVKHISQKPHAVGFPAHLEVQRYIIDELHKLGLETDLQEGVTAGDWGNLSQANNILARIKGSGQGKSLLLLSHYDSNPHSSLGASDAGSGVATILEGLRAFLAKGETPKNDIIVLISDAEELGLNGADLFVNQHPWAKEVGLVLNFEARGSGGPSYMLIETNRGNGRLIEEFTKADPQYPVANSLVYSVYKMLPNDTDLTIFREDRDIEGFNFAFIDDHFDYHSVRDSYERLDTNSLSHQGSYLMPLLSHFSNTDLGNLKSLNDYVYFNIPFFRLVSYPFEWIWPIFALAVLFFILLLVQGFRKKVLVPIQMAKGFIPVLLALTINGVVGYFSFSVLKWMYPRYNDILHGFTYNGYTYITAFVIFAVGVCFWVYHRFKSLATVNLLVAPLLIWLSIGALVAVYLPGASFFMVPVYALLAAFLVIINQKGPNPFLLVILVLPAIWIYAPLIKMFPVGLGLKMMITTTLLTTLTFFLLLPVFAFYRKKKTWAITGMILFVACMISAHFTSNFTEDRAKPSSLLYVLDADTNTAKWATYDQVLIDWNEQYLGEAKKTAEPNKYGSLSSKYSTGFSYVSDAPMKNIALPKIATSRDTVIGNSRILNICIEPMRKVNRLDIFTNAASINSATVNGVPLSEDYLKSRKNGKLITHYISDNAYTELQLNIPVNQVLELAIFEASNDLLENPLFSIPERPKNSISMPFVLNDAILVTKTLRFE